MRQARLCDVDIAHSHLKLARVRIHDVYAGLDEHAPLATQRLVVAGGLQEALGHLLRAAAALGSGPRRGPRIEAAWGEAAERHDQLRDVILRGLEGNLRPLGG